MQKLKSEMDDKIATMHLELDNDRAVSDAIAYHGIEAVKFVNWTNNTLDVFRKCPNCGTHIDVSFTHCRLCWTRGACEDGENYEGDY